jgi:hypothetical protein
MQPKEVSDTLITFPATVVKEYMIPRDQIPKDYPNKEFFTDLQSRWFFSGLERRELPKPKEGIDPVLALRHLQAIQGSFEPTHEHKEACVAYFLSLWFQGPETVDRQENTGHTKPKVPKKPSKGQLKRRR